MRRLLLSPAWGLGLAACAGPTHRFTYPQGTTQPRPAPTVSEPLVEAPAPVEEEALSPPEHQSVTYQRVHEDVLAPRCLSCHGIPPGRTRPLRQPDLSTPVQARKYWQDIENTVYVKKSMPPQRDLDRLGPLSVEQLDLLRKWLDSGRP